METDFHCNGYCNNCFGNIAYHQLEAIFKRMAGLKIEIKKCDEYCAEVGNFHLTVSIVNAKDVALMVSAEGGAPMVNAEDGAPMVNPKDVAPIVTTRPSHAFTDEEATDMNLFFATDGGSGGQTDLRFERGGG